MYYAVFQTTNPETGVTHRITEYLGNKPNMKAAEKAANLLLVRLFGDAEGELPHELVEVCKMGATFNRDIEIIRDAIIQGMEEYGVGAVRSAVRELLEDCERRFNEDTRRNRPAGPRNTTEDLYPFSFDPFSPPARISTRSISMAHPHQWGTITRDPEAPTLTETQLSQAIGRLPDETSELI